MLINFTVRIFAVILQILSNYLLVYVLSAKDFSEFSYIMSMVLILSIFSRLGLPVILVREVIDEFTQPSKRRLALQVLYVMSSSVMLSVLVVLIASYWYGLESTLLLIFPVIITNGAIFLSSIYRGLGNGAVSLTIETIIRPLSIMAALGIALIYDTNNVLVLVIGAHFLYMVVSIYVFQKGAYKLIRGNNRCPNSDRKTINLLEYLRWLRQIAYPTITGGLFKNSTKIMENFAIVVSASFLLGPAFLKIFLLFVLVSRTVNSLLLVTFSKDIRSSYTQGRLLDVNRKISLFAMYDFIASTLLFLIVLCTPELILLMVPNEELHTALIYVQIYTGMKLFKSLVGNYNIWLGVLGLDNKIFGISIFLNMFTLFCIFFATDLIFIFAALILYDTIFALIGIFVVKRNGIVSGWWLNNIVWRR